MSYKHKVVILSPSVALRARDVATLAENVEMLAYEVAELREAVAAQVGLDTPRVRFGAAWRRRVPVWWP